MKKRIISIIIATLPFFCSCNDWLTAVSSAQTEGYELLNTKDGYYNTLTGVYLLASDRNLYGESLSYVFTDLASIPAVSSSTGNFNHWQIHDYGREDCQMNISSIWQRMYGAIANINFVLKELDGHRDLFSNETEFNLIRGELLGMRAFLHFDLLRLFGLDSWSEANAGKMTVPYVTVYSMDIPLQQSYAEAQKMLLADLDEAIKALEKDPARGKVDPLFENAANSEGYWNVRKRHMNYYAALALKARVLRWMGEGEKAASVAKTVVEEAFASKFASWYDYKKYSVESREGKDLVFSTEVLFGLTVNGLINDSFNILNTIMNVSSGLRLDQAFIDNVLYPNVDPITGSLAGREDIRGPETTLYFMLTGYNSDKLRTAVQELPLATNLVPMIGIAEMYYIMAENHIEKGEEDQARACLDAVRKSRGITDNLTAMTPVGQELAKEYYREFNNLGQVFFFLKRTRQKWDIASLYMAIEPEDLILPYPNEELEYGRNQER